MLTTFYIWSLRFDTFISINMEKKMVPDTIILRFVIGYHSKSKFDMDFYPRLPYGSYKKLYGQFYNPPYHTYPCNQGVRGYEKPPVPLYPVTPIYPMKEKRLVIKEAKKIYHFTTGDVDAVLYGYLRDESNAIPQLHSLSGVRFENHNPSG